MSLIQSAAAYLPKFTVDVARLGIWLALLTVVFAPLERWFALRPARLARRELICNLFFYFLNSLLPALLLGLLMPTFAVAAQYLVPSVVPAAVNTLPLPAKLALALLIGEVGFYWG